MDGINPSFSPFFGQHFHDKSPVLFLFRTHVLFYSEQKEKVAIQSHSVQFDTKTGIHFFDWKKWIPVEK